MTWIALAVGSLLLLSLAARRPPGSASATTSLWVAAAAVLAVLASLRFGGRALLLAAPLAAWLLWSLAKRPRPQAREPDASGRPRARMSREEALRVLGLAEGASPDEIVAAHRKLIKKLHPDQGGSGFLAQQVTEAKQVLLGR